MTLRVYCFRSMGTIAIVLGLMSFLSVSELQIQGQLGCNLTVQPGQSIQKAIERASEGVVVCLEVGTWEENLTINKSLTLRGMGKEFKQVRIVGAKEGHPVMRIESEQEITVQIENLMSAGAKGDLCAVRDPQWICPVGLQVLGKAKVFIKDVQVSNNEFLGLWIWDSSTVSLTNSTVSGNSYDGLIVGDSATVSLSNSRISDNEGDGLFVWGSATVEIRESTMSNNKHCGISVSSPEAQVHGTPNTMRDNGADLCGFAPAYLRQPLVPQDPRPTLAVPADYASVQQAIDAIVPGGTIELAAGSYEEGLTIWKPLVLRGAGQEQTILQASPERKLVLSIIAGVQGVRIEGLQLRGSQGEALLIYAQEVTVHDTMISDNRIGLEVWGSGTVSLTNSTVSSNWLGGLGVSDSARVSLADSTVSHNRFIGLAIGGSAVVNLSNSTISSNRDIGLGVMQYAAVSLTDSTISGNGQNGLLVLNSASVEIRSSIIEDNGTREYCKEVDWNCNGIEVHGASQTMITESKVLNNADWGLAAALKKCGHYEDNFTGKLTLDERTVIAGNNKAGNHEGEICLP